MHASLLLLVAAWTSPNVAQSTTAWRARMRMPSTGCRPAILSSAGEPPVPVPPKDINIRLDEPHASLRPRWLIPWLKFAKAWPIALDIWSSTWAGIFLAGSLREVAGKPVKLFDGIKSMAQFMQAMYVTRFGELSIGEALKQEFPNMFPKWFLIPASILMGVNMFLDFKSKGMKGVLNPAWIWKRIKQVGSGVIGALGLVTWVSWQPAQQYTSYLACLLPLIYSLPDVIDAFYFARWAFKTDEGRDYGRQWKEYRHQVQEYRRQMKLKAKREI